MKRKICVNVIQVSPPLADDASNKPLISERRGLPNARGAGGACTYDGRLP